MTKLRTRRNLRIYKPNNTDTHWTFAKKIQGKKYYFQLHGTDRECKDLADKIDCHLHNNPIEATIAKFQPWKVAPPPSSPQFSEILDYLDSIADAVGIDMSTLTSYRSSVRTLSSVATNSDPEKALDCRVADLTPKLFLKFKVAKLASAGGDQEDKQSAKRTVNRVLRSVKAIFSESKVEVYPEHWNLRGIDEFRKCKPFPKVGKKYRLPEKDLILNTFNLWRDYESKDPDKYVSLGLALHFGLRRMEIWNCRRDWLNLDGDNCVLTIRRERDFKPKSGEEGDTRGLTGAAEQILEVATGADYLMTVSYTHLTLPTILLV